MRTDRTIRSPATVGTLNSHRDQLLCGVLPVSRLRPGDDKGPGRQRERLVQAKAGTFVCRPDAEVRVEKDSAALLGTRAVRPIFRVRGHQVAAVFAEVKARFCLDEVLDVDHAEALAVVEELVVFV